jgi:hypothetical protein
MSFDIQEENYEWDRWSNFWVENPLVVNTETLGDMCSDVRYKLKAMLPSSGEYIYYDDLIHQLELSGFDLEQGAYLWFSDNGYEMNSGAGGYSYLSGSFTDKAFESTNDDGVTLKEYFTDADGETAIYFKVYAIVPGSTVQGPSMANDDNQAVASFKVVLVPEELVEQCQHNEIHFNDVLTGTNEQRANPLVY